VNILLISRCPPYPLYLGDRLIVYHLARQLARRGHVIDLIAFSDRFEDIADRVNYADLFRQITVVPDPPRTVLDYGVRLFTPKTRLPQRADQAWSPSMWDAIRQHVEHFQYDLVHFFGGIQVYEYARAVKPLPAMITPYESYSLYLRRMVEGEHPRAFLQGLRDRLQLRIARSFESWMFNHYRRVIVVSDRDRDELQTLNPGLPVDVIPNGVDLEYFQPEGKPRDPLALLFTGNYEYAPNVDAGLRLATAIFPRLRERIPGAKLWIVGNAPPPELQAVASDAITVTGRVEDMRLYLEQAAVFVCPLRLGAGIKNKVLEALAMRCPVIATTLSLDGIAVNDGQEVLIANTDDEFVDVTMHLLGDTEKRERLGANGRALIEAQYSWSQVAERYESVYREITE
jgi:glycosyltransferase involved in cell wall biosynthesis